MKKLLIFLATIMIILSFSRKTSATSLGLVDTSGSNLNIRQEASASSKIIGKIPNNSYIEILGNKNDFYYVSYNNLKGYSHKNYVKFLSSSLMQTTDNLNLRQAKSTTSSIILTIPKGREITVYNRLSSWSYVGYNGKFGYVSNTYLTSAGISLAVPSFKQYDTRWKDIKITSTKTIHQIGCLTTAMAMSESYRLKQTIYPNEMVKKLSYTSSGDMYWPSNYKTSTTGSYLSVIYNNLKNNKPTIIGVRNSSSTHFVIVYGMSGPQSSLSSYKIYDPASTSRLRLKDLFNVYPSYMKIAYYL